MIRWSQDPGQYIANSLSPARVEMVRLVDPAGQHAHVLVPPDQLSLAIGREGQNVRLAARLTGWKIDIKNSTEYDQAAEDAVVSELISQREQDEAQQREAEERLAVEQAARAEEDARLRELYPLPEDEEDYYVEGEADQQVDDPTTDEQFVAEDDPAELTEEPTEEPTEDATEEPTEELAPETTDAEVSEDSPVSEDGEVAR